MIIKAKPIDTVFFNTALSNTLRPCGLEFAEGIRPPFAKNRTSFTTSNTSDAENLGAVATLPAAACVPSGTGGTLLSQPSHKTTQAPCSPPESPACPVPTPGGETPVPARSGAGLGPTGPSLAEVTGEAEKPFFVFCFSQAGNKKHRSLKPTHSSLSGRASRAPARRCRSAQKAGRSPHPLCRKERSL